METFATQLRQVLRRLARAPMLAAVALLTLARVDQHGLGLGIGNYLRREVDIELVTRELIARTIGIELAH